MSELWNTYQRLDAAARAEGRNGAATQGELNRWLADLFAAQKAQGEPVGLPPPEDDWK
jgi:hypothetical protein